MTEANSFFNHSGVVLLSGGASMRMGSPKALLSYPDGSLLIDTIIDFYQTIGFQNITVVIQPQVLKEWKCTSQRSQWNFQICTVNSSGNDSRFISIQTGIKSLHHCHSIFIHNIDNPYLNKDIILSMPGLIDRNRYVVPSYIGRRGHPLLIGTDVINDILQQNENSDNFKELLSKFSRVELDVTHSQILANINTPKDWQQWIQKKL